MDMSATGAPLTLRLLRSYDIINMDYNTAAQDDALARLGRQMDGVSRRLAYEILQNCGDLNHPDARLLLQQQPPIRRLVKHFKDILDDIDTPAGLHQVAQQKLLAPLLRHVFLDWLVAHLWAEPLATMDVPSHALVLEDRTWGASTAEKEAALQLDAAAYQRLHKRLAAFIAAGTGSSRSQQHRGWPTAQLAEAFHNFCAYAGLCDSYHPAREMFLQAYQLRLVMGAAHPELRPFISKPGEHVSSSSGGGGSSRSRSSRHSVVKIVASGTSRSGSGTGSLYSRCQEPARVQVVASRSVGWQYLFAGPTAAPARQEEVVVRETTVQQQGQVRSLSMVRSSRSCFGSGR
jgi:hypothetical protein